MREMGSKTVTGNIQMLTRSVATGRKGGYHSATEHQHANADRHADRNCCMYRDFGSDDECAQEALGTTKREMHIESMQGEKNRLTRLALWTHTVKSKSMAMRIS